MIDFIRFFFKPNKDEAEILKAIEDIEASGIKSMRVVGRGTLTVDVKEVTQTEKFKEYAQKAHEIVHSRSA
mgnify:CR=1 FL=1